MMSTFFKRAVVTTFAGCLASGAVGCGGPEQETPSQDELAVQTRALTATRSNVSAGECTATVSLNRSGTSLAGTCSNICKDDGAVTLRFYIEAPDAAGVYRSVGFNYTGHSARSTGTVNLTVLNQPTGTYRARCNVDYSDPKDQTHSGGDVIAGPATF